MLSANALVAAGAATAAALTTYFATVALVIFILRFFVYFKI